MTMIKNAHKVTPNQLLTQGGRFYLPSTSLDHSVVKLFVFVAEWCGHCRRLAQTLNDLTDAYARSGRSPPFTVYVMEDSDPFTSNVMEKMGVTGFPSIYKILSGGELIPYKGPRDAKGLLAPAYLD